MKLDKALYGCVESAVSWYKNLRPILETDGYEVNPYDLCELRKIYNFHVDDLLAECAFKEGLEKLYEVLIKKYEMVKVTRHPYLGMIADF